MTADLAIGVDLGGTNLKVAVVDTGGHVLTKELSEGGASRGPQAIITEIADTLDRLLSETGHQRSQLKGLGIGAPGPLSHRSGRIIRCANLSDWVDVPLRDLLQERLGVPVALDNDGNAAALGEFWAGAGRGCQNLVLLTLGTGVGAGVILDGKLLRGHFENAGELGHMIVQAEGEPCPCGQRGCLERYASASAVARFADAAGFSPRGEAAKEGGQEIDAEQVADAARQDDPVCVRVWEDACRYLAIACVNIQHAFNVERVVLGGGMSAAGDFLLDGVRKHLERETWSLHIDAPEVVLATLGNDAGVIGAAALILQSQVASGAHAMGS